MTQPNAIMRPRGEHPISFKPEMIRAIIAGRKTQTRRLINPQPAPTCGLDRQVNGWLWPHKSRHNPKSKFHGVGIARPVANFKERMMQFYPYGSPGDKLWVREVFAELGRWERHAIGQTGDAENVWEGLRKYQYPSTMKENTLISAGKEYWRTFPSIHMPREASRMDLMNLDGWCERLWEIDQAGCIAEGCYTIGRNGYRYDETAGGVYQTPLDAYRALWDTIATEDGTRWLDNPWVWVTEFLPERVEHAA